MGDRKLKNVCYSTQSLEMYLSEKARTHKCYKTYTVSDRIQSWIDSDCFYLDDGSRWNDIHDRETFNYPQNNIKCFGRCFSFSTSESVAMWMLYGGTQKDGAMLEFSQKAMSDLIKDTAHVELGRWVDNNFVSEITLQKGQFDLTLQDILYVGELDAASAYIRRSDESCKDAPASVIRQLSQCVKSVAWSYENECRLILTVNKDLLPQGSAITSVRVPLNGLLNTDKVRIYCSPNFRGKKVYRTSKLSGEIDWDLCYRCTGPISL